MTVVGYRYGLLLPFHQPLLHEVKMWNRVAATHCWTFGILLH